MSRLEPKILWEPSPEFIRNSNMFKYAECPKANYGKDFGRVSVYEAPGAQVEEVQGHA
jgi:hypothetical protein